MKNRDNPFENVERMFEQMRRSMLGGDVGFEARMLPAGETVEQDGFGFDANVSMDAVEGGYVVYADLPGFETEELDVRFDDGVLVIEGTHEMTDETSDEMGEMSHIQHRHVHEQLSVPGDVLEGEIEATYRNGVLILPAITSWNISTPRGVENLHVIIAGSMSEKQPVM
jgi:HSP20 family protein